MANIISNVIIAVIASVLAIIIFQGIQYAFFNESLRDISTGNYTWKSLTINVQNITNDYVLVFIQRDDQTCNLKERDSCYSGCHRITLVDIKQSVVDVDIVDDILCEIQRSAYDFGQGVFTYGGKGKETVENVTKEWIKQ